MCPLPATPLPRDAAGWWGGTLIVFVGAVIWQSGRGQRRLVAAAIVLGATAVAFAVTPWLRLAITGLLTGGI